MNYIIILSILSCIFLPENLQAQTTPPQSPNTTVEDVAITTENPKPKIIDVSASILCKKKCRCDLEHKLLDCTNSNLTKWFTDNEFNILRNGNIQFEIIRLDHNQLENIPILPELSSIKQLILAHNRIKTIESGAFKNLSQLKILDLSHNRLTSKILKPSIFEGRYSPTTYEPLNNVVELNLSYNELHSLDPDLFEHFPNLEKLSLSGNVFQVIDQLTETAIASLTTLKVLDMSFMELETLPDYIFHSPREKLEKLILTGNLFKQLPNALSFAINLKDLNLDENPLNNIEGENVFPRITSLETLSLSFLKRTKQFGKGAFSGLENLKVLYATNNVYLSDIHPSAFARPVQNSTDYDYPPLEKLYLHNNNLTVLSKTLLDRWDKVNVIDLRMNPWKCDTDNDFLIHDLFPQILSSTPTLSTKVTCSEPKNYHNVEIKEIYENKKALRGPDLYGNHPENDGALLVGMLIGLIVGIPFAFTMFLIYKRGCFGLIRRPTDYGGALYKRADDFDF